MQQHHVNGYLKPAAKLLKALDAAIDRNRYAPPVVADRISETRVLVRLSFLVYDRRSTMMADRYEATGDARRQGTKFHFHVRASV